MPPLQADQFEKILPPTPPNGDIPLTLNVDLNSPPAASPATINFAEPVLPVRPRKNRRPLSGYPPQSEPTFPQVRKATDPGPIRPSTYDLDARPQQLDVDLDTYSSTEYDGEDAETASHEPTLSFVTTSTIDSSTRTPSISGAYGFGTPDLKAGEDVRIRVRQNPGRNTAYSSAESSMGSGAFSYHMPESQFHPHPPPMPTHFPIHDTVGLGISTRDANKYQEIASSVSSPAEFVHRPWRRDVTTRLRSGSTSSTSTDTASTVDSRHEAYSYQFPEQLSWQSESPHLTVAEAVAMVDEGRDERLDIARLKAMGGVQALTTEFCKSLEELNISGNPLRVLPAWIGGLTALRMLVADQCSLGGLVADTQNLERLHTLCVRRNRLVSLPSWLCLLKHLETLRVDDNPFVTEWLPIVAPILSNPPVANLPTRSTSVRRSDHFLRSATSIASLASSMTASSIHSRDAALSTEPWLSPSNSANHSMHHLGPIAEDIVQPHSAPLPAEPTHDEDELQPPRAAALTGSSSYRSLRKMRSAGSLFGRGSVAEPAKAGPSRPVTQDGRPGSRSQTISAAGRGASMADYSEDERSASPLARPLTNQETGSKTKWGFLRKMSMNKLRQDKHSEKHTLIASASANLKSMPPLSHANSDPITTLPHRPGMASAKSVNTLPTIKTSISEMNEFGRFKTSVSASTLPRNLPARNQLMNDAASKRAKRRSFLPVDNAPSISVAIPSTSPFMPTPPALESSETASSENDRPVSQSRAFDDVDEETRYVMGLESIKSYLRDLYDLSRPIVETYRGFEIIDAGSSTVSDFGSPPSITSHGSVAHVRRRRPTLDTQNSGVSIPSMHESDLTTPSTDDGKKFKDDKTKRARVIREIWETERTYVRGLGELVHIYVKPAQAPISKSSTETVVPLPERKIVFGGIESILTIHRDNLLRSLEATVKPLIEGQDDEEGQLSAHTAHEVGKVFQEYITYMKQYSTYINNFDNALTRMKTWTQPLSAPSTPGFPSKPSSPHTIASAVAGAGMSAISLPLSAEVSHSGTHMTPAQKKRVRSYMKRCRAHPMHAQINLESYLLLPIQRVPRYKLLLEDLAMCTPPRLDGPQDKLDAALQEIANLASLMNEEKRESESRLRLLQWQQRITSRGPSPLVQPHRKLILDGRLNLIRLIKKGSSFVEVDSLPTTDGEQTIMPSKAVVPIEHIVPEPMERIMVLILCSDILVLASPRGEGGDVPVDLFNVLRMGTMKEPASIVQNNILRVVDNKSIYYFNAPGQTTTLEWCRAINTARRR
ncbi:hypothetical protein TREMEDRAFT_25033 [Tremella mesenterica DSM 1558]|uniref:uncharacterized protein n=1 Tax=Tremella mesenterica (strain ATCC 24925 / CBS 8224 / DSM 1558 / NBRC 9311 / NRRL Y-6157 / RJB 2259-6 / UBC 559-6) TaxID=578456 RepID=UPI0003F49AA4|nr:uncharacterized protein TREMEDRAFT_25033 [Tremella mesenterica DSM 1558]EIW73519.1 hypothetical protein TREMEDRAFT_25033 [Tremella mesenterica DSM 1558]